MVDIKPQKDFPLIGRYREIFPINENTIFAYDHKIYCNHELPDHLIIHEMVHHMQQDKYGLETWVDRYLHDPQFRLDMEVQAYRTQIKSIKDGKAKARTLILSAKDLSSPLYRDLLTYKQAINLLN